MEFMSEGSEHFSRQATMTTRTGEMTDNSFYTEPSYINEQDTFVTNDTEGQILITEVSEPQDSDVDSLEEFSDVSSDDDVQRRPRSTPHLPPEDQISTLKLPTRNATPRSAPVQVAKPLTPQLRPASPYKPPPNIFDDDGWDTDLETDLTDYSELHDTTGHKAYCRRCEEMGVVPVTYFLKHMNDQHLVMRCHGLGANGTAAIARALKDNVSVERLDLAGNWMEPEGGRSMAEMLSENGFIHRVNNKTLTSINLSRNNITSEGGLLLGPSLADNTTLEEINLSWNRLRGPGAKAIAAGAKENVRLKRLDLSWNGFSSDGGAALADLVQNNHSITELDISGNRLDEKCAALIGKALPANDTLISLKMGNNPIMTTGALMIIKGVAQNDHDTLRFLDLTDIPVERRFLDVIDSMEDVGRDIRVQHGPAILSGNTRECIGTPQRDYNVKAPLVILQDAIKVRDYRLIDILLKLDSTGTHSVTKAQFSQALQELGVPFTTSEIDEFVKKLARTPQGRISFAEFVQLKEASEDS